MKKIEAQIVADSISPQGIRIMTYLLTYPRFIHSELMTHRVFSRNSASSRAIPFEKMVKMVEEEPFIPIAWQKDHKGMQGSEYLDSKVPSCEGEWLRARSQAVRFARELNTHGVTKQLCNRLLEPFMWHTVLVTATEYTNFYELRCPKIYHAATGLYYKSVKDWNNVDKDIQYTGLSCLHPDNQSQAEIHIQALAEAMWDARNESTPNQLEEGEWHIPFLNTFDNFSDLPESSSAKDLSVDFDRNDIKIATARCARLSYMTFDNEIDYEKDIQLHDRLLASHHMSPFEHCARAMSNNEYDSFIKGRLPQGHEVIEFLEGRIEDYPDRNTKYGWCNNFRGFIQYRYLVENSKI